MRLFFFGRRLICWAWFSFKLRLLLLFICHHWIGHHLTNQVRRNDLTLNGMFLLLLIRINNVFSTGWFLKFCYFFLQLFDHLTFFIKMRFEDYDGFFHFHHELFLFFVLFIFLFDKFLKSCKYLFEFLIIFVILIRN